MIIVHSVLGPALLGHWWVPHKLGAPHNLRGTCKWLIVALEPALLPVQREPRYETLHRAIPKKRAFSILFIKLRWFLNSDSKFRSSFVWWNFDESQRDLAASTLRSLVRNDCVFSFTNWSLLNQRPKSVWSLLQNFGIKKIKKITEFALRD